jgi:Flp pilus assembly protein TadD
MTLSPEILSALEAAAAQQDAGDYAAAERAYWQVLGQNSHVADAWNLLGLMAHELGRSDVARVYIHRAIELDPANGYFHNAMGRTLLALGLREKAVGALKLAAKLDPTDPDAWNNLGAALHDADRPELAVESLNAP